MSETNKTVKVSKNDGKFKKGQKRPANAGRKKGTPNKRSINLDEKLQELGFDVVDEYICIYNSTEDEQLKANICKEFMKYCYPQRKAVEFDSTGAGNVEIVINRKSVEVDN